MLDNAIQPLINQLASGAHLTFEQSARAFQIVMNGGATPAQMGAFLMALKLHGETADEIAGGAMALRAKMTKVEAPAGTIDVCGTGGDMHGTVNVSTAVAFVVAACGVPVAKHGGRAVSSLSGSSDVLKELGINIEMNAERAAKCLRETGFIFLFAPNYHTAMRHVAPVRQELKTRTIFNILGPLINPASPDFQLLGVYDKKLTRTLAEVLQKLGTKAAWVVAGADGLDELSIAGKTHVAQLKDGAVTEFDVSPEDAGLTPEPLIGLKGGDVEHNAKELRSVLMGTKGGYRNVVVLNAAAALVVAGKAADLKAGAQLATDAIDTAKAYGMLQKLMDASHG